MELRCVKVLWKFLVKKLWFGGRVIKDFLDFNIEVVWMIMFNDSFNIELYIYGYFFLVVECISYFGVDEKEMYIK